jgi:hypothetical protein
MNIVSFEDLGNSEKRTERYMASWCYIMDLDQAESKLVVPVA